MEDKELLKDYLRNRLETEINNARLTTTSCTMSTIRWLQRYAHCYSILCSFFCIPLWILILPIAFAFDICIYIIASIIFIIVFIVHFLIAPCTLTYRFSSCLDAWNPANIYRYSLIEALRWFQTVVSFFDVMWMCYCGSGEIENGAPIFCIYCCCSGCHESCHQATKIEIRDQPCTIL
jgi:hypothetical protein